MEVITIEDDKKEDEEEEVIILDDQPEVTITYDNASQDRIQIIDDRDCVPLINEGPSSPTRRCRSPNKRTKNSANRRH